MFWVKVSISYILITSMCHTLIIKDEIKKYISEIFKKNNIKIGVEEIFDYNWRFSNFNSEQKEIINSCTEFFYFIKHNENFEVIDKMFNNIDTNVENIKIEFIEKKSFLISIIIFKSFLNYSPVYISNFGEYKNSDKLLDYCVETYISYCVFNDLDYVSKKKIRSVFYICFYLLIKAGIIKEKKIKVNKFLNKFWKIEINNKKICEYQNFRISYVSFKIKKKKDDTYLVGSLFWNVYDIYSKNFYSDTKFNITKEEYLDLLIKRYLYIDVEHFKWIKKIYNEEINDLDDINKELINTLDEKNWNIETKNNIIINQKKYSKKIENIVLHNFLNTNFNEKDKIYFPFYFDFRGRKYYNSIIGPTQNKILRFVYHYGWYNQEDFSNIIKIDRIYYFQEKIKFFCDKNKLEYNDIFLENYFWLLIGIGKFKIVKSKIEIKDEEIINCGIEIIENKEIESFENIEKIEITHYWKIMETLTTTNINNIKKRIISKDGTASVYQISTILLKPKDQNSLKWINLYNKNSWIDTYSFIIKKFKEDSKINNEEINIFDRKSTKKILMTIPYSIGKSSSYNYFIEELKNLKIEHKQYKNLKKIHNKFYDYVKNNFEMNYLYSISTKEHINKIMDEYLKIRNIPIYTETGRTDLSYKKMERKTIDLIFEMKINENIIKERIVKLIMIPSNSIDYSQTSVSLGANLRHFYEADLLRITEIYLNYSINSIHDAELIDFNSCSKLILIKNRIFKELLPEYDVYSIFIII